MRSFLRTGHGETIMKRSPSPFATESTKTTTALRGSVRRHSAHVDLESVDAPKSAMRPRGGGSGDGGRRGESDHPAATPKMLARVKEAVLHLLSHHERLLLVLWYVERMTVAEIARTLNLTEQQADRMHAEVLTKLRLAA
jgi:DNA-directed RNA polymerase specialized sigma24 family protein